MKKTYIQTVSKFKERILSVISEQTDILRGLLVFAFGFCFANATLFGAVAPLGVSFTASVPKKQLSFSTAGVLLGYALSQQPVGNLKYIAAVLLLFAFRKFVQDAKTVSARSRLAVCSATLATLLPGGVLTAYLDLTPHLAVLTLAESCLAGTTAFFLLRTRETLQIRRSLGLLKPSEFGALLICFAALSIGIGSIFTGKFAIGRSILTFAVVATAYLCREGTGTIFGLCAGLALSVGDVSLMHYIAGWGFGGLAGGLFAYAGRLGTALSVLFACSFAALFSPDGVPQFAIFQEALPACILFMCVPARYWDRIKPYVSRMGSEPDSLTGSTVFRLRYAGESLRQIGKAVNAIAQRLPTLEDDPSAAVETAVQEVCAGCEQRAVCWGNRFDAMQEAILALFKRFGADPPPAFSDYPPVLLQECRHAKIMAAELQQQQRALQRRLGTKRRLQSVQAVVAEQFEGLSGLLEELASRFEQVHAYDARSTAALTEYLEKHGTSAASAMVCEDFGGRRRAEVCIRLSSARQLSLPVLAETVSRICEVEMELCDLSETDSHQRLLFLQQATYKLDFGVRQIAKDGKFCGDSYDHFIGEDGAAYLLLSDGMGTGGRAAVDSAMTCSLLGRLISAGFPFAPALQLVNSAMLVKSSDESLATLDLTRICLFSGETELIKCGAAPTFIRRNGRVGAIAASSLPIGILNGVSCERRSVSLQGGDMVVMVSDGVTGEDAGWLRKLMELWHGSAAELAEIVAEQASERRQDGHTDDITVVTAILRKN